MKDYKTQLFKSLIHIILISLLYTIFKNSSTKRRIYGTNIYKSTSLHEWEGKESHREFTSDKESKHYYFINNNNHKIHARLYETNNNNNNNINNNNNKDNNDYNNNNDNNNNNNNNNNPFVVFFHGIGSHVNRYTTSSNGDVIGNHFIADLFNKQGIFLSISLPIYLSNQWNCVIIGMNFYSYDAQGHGISEGTKVYVEDWNTYIDDAEQFVSLLQKRNKNKSFYLFGESFGGATALHLSHRYQLTNRTDFKGTMLVSPAISPKLPPKIVIYALRYFLTPFFPRYQPPFMPNSLPLEKIWEDKVVLEWMLTKDALTNCGTPLRLQTGISIYLSIYLFYFPFYLISHINIYLLHI
jgi:pimeloyl-ACP methyl ester carboxylesterase